MRSDSSFKAAAVLAIGLAAGAGSTHAAEPVLAPDPDLQATLVKMDAAHVEFHNGRPEASKALWSHADDVVLIGGAGGAIERGWKSVSARLDWASAQYSRGTQRNERVDVTMNGNLAVVSQYEHIRFHVPGQAQESKRDYRVTMVFRREADGWRVIHRHADTMTVKQAPK